MTAVRYSISVAPSRALLGEKVVATLRCTAEGDATGVMTFEHRSLEIVLEGPHLPEALVAFPNRQAIEDGQGRLIRMSATGGIEDLKAGEERTRSFDLLSLFPAALLAIGDLDVSFHLEEAEPPVRPVAAAFAVRSGQAAVPLLIDQLAAGTSAVRHIAVDLLERMTGKHLGSAGAVVLAGSKALAERWRDWWHDEGSLLPWNSAADGATYGQAPAAVDDVDGGHVGGVVHPARP